MDIPSNDIPSILERLLGVSDEEIEGNHDALVQALRTLETRIGNLDKSPARKLFEAVQAEAPLLSKLAEKSPRDIISENQQERDHLDERLLHVISVAGNPDPSASQRLHRGAGSRALGIEFTKSQRNSRVENICQLLSSGKKISIVEGRRGAVAHYVSRDHSLAGAQVMAVLAIRDGIKILVFERLLEKRLKTNDLPLVTPISALVTLTGSPFWRLPYTAMPEFIDILLDPDSTIPMPVEGSDEHKYLHVLDIVRPKTDWSLEFQHDYDHGLDEPSPKRVRAVPSITPGPFKNIQPRPYHTGDSQRPTVVEDCSATGSEQSQTSYQHGHPYNGYHYVTQTLPPGNSFPMVSSLSGARQLRLLDWIDSVPSGVIPGHMPFPSIDDPSGQPLIHDSLVPSGDQLGGAHPLLSRETYDQQRTSISDSQSPWAPHMLQTHPP